MPRRRDDYRGMASESRLRALNAVLDTPGLGLTELAEATGLHVNTLRDHVRVLESHGLILSEVEHRATRGRPRTVYRPVTDAASSPMAQRRLTAAREHGDLLRRIAPTDATSGLDDDATHQLDVLYEHLDDAGLEPDITDDGMRLDLVPCPFHDLVDGNLKLACGVHEKVIRLILGQAGGPVELESLQPFTTEHVCTVHLTARGCARGTESPNSAPADSTD